jgi:hypothetical protein
MTKRSPPFQILAKDSPSVRQILLRKKTKKPGKSLFVTVFQSGGDDVFVKKRTRFSHLAIFSYKKPRSL